jgi:predicted nucleic acid-binding Zn ribbon protein
MSTPIPLGDVSVTPPACPACGAPLPAGKARRFCSPACRQGAYRRRHQTVAAKAQLPGRRSRLEGTIYQCSECETRYLAEQWCPDCARPCQRLGPGGICPCCEEMITVQELTEETGASSPLPVPGTSIHH